MYYLTLVCLIETGWVVAETRKYGFVGCISKRNATLHYSISFITRLPSDQFGYSFLCSCRESTFTLFTIVARRNTHYIAGGSIFDLKRSCAAFYLWPTANSCNLTNMIKRQSHVACLAPTWPILWEALRFSSRTRGHTALWNIVRLGVPKWTFKFKLSLGWSRFDLVIGCNSSEPPSPF